MHTTLFSEISLLIAFSAIIALVMRLLRQPLIIGHIITGILIGPNVLGLVSSVDTIDVFAKIGIALLLFIIGLGLNPKVILEVGRPAIVVGGLQMIGTTVVGIASSLLLDFTTVESVMFGLATSFSSTIIILKVLSDRHEQTRLFGKVTIGILLIQDIVAAFILLIVTAQGKNTGFDIGQLAILVAKGMLIGVPLMLVGTYVLPRMQRLVAGSQEFLFLFAIGWGFGAAALFEKIGFSLEIGSLIAGVALAGLPYATEISARLRPLRDFFVVVFFINLGVHLNIVDISSVLPIVIVGTAIVLVAKPLIVMTVMGFLGYTKQTSFKTAITHTQISEFSLVMVNIELASKVVSGKFVDGIVLIAILTIACSTYLMSYSDKLFMGLVKRMKMFERSKTYSDRMSKKNTYDVLIFGLNKGGHEFIRLFKSMNKKYVVIDYDPDVIDKLEHAHVPYIYGDVTDPELLSEVDMSKVKIVVSCVTDFETTKFLVKSMDNFNPSAVVITQADSANQANILYEMGASYVIMPHFIGSEKISSFLKKSGLKKAEFQKYRDKHVAHINSGFYVDL
jgi:Kef-type K+ transport system membrane component KefB